MPYFSSQLEFVGGVFLRKCLLPGYLGLSGCRRKVRAEELV